MKKQDYSNHTRFVPGFHYVTGTLVIVIFLYNTVRLAKTVISGHWMFTHLMYYCIIPFLVALTLVLLFWYSRRFAVVAQDRAIRAEESLRYFILTGKAIDPRITMRQIIALRFASDEEFKALVEEAAGKNLSEAEIKKSIKNWRPDNHRA